MERRSVDGCMARLLLVEDHPGVRREFSEALGELLPWAEISVCKDLPDAQAMLEAAPPDVLVVDLGLPSGSGLQLIRSARMLWGDRCHSLVLTVTGNDEFLLRAVVCGACGVLYKSDDPATWCSAIEVVLDGGSPVIAAVAHTVLALPVSSPALGSMVRDVAELVVSGYTLSEIAVRTGQPPQAVAQSIRKLYRALWECVPQLSPRELELIRLLGKGNGFKQCAALMGIGEATTKTLATRAYAKLGASNLQTALYEARTLGFLT